MMGIGWENFDWIGTAQDRGTWSIVESSMKFQISQYLEILTR